MAAYGTRDGAGGASAHDDAALIRAARAGEHDAYETLWRRHARPAIGFVRPLARSDAEDVVAEAFTAIWEQLQRGVGPSERFRPYLMRVARNIAARNYRDRRHQLTNFEFEGDPVAGNDEFSTRREDGREIVAAFRELPERWQQALWMTEVEEMPRQLIAERLELNPNTVSVTVRRAREGLRLAWLRRHLPAAQELEHPEIVEALPKFVRGALSSRRAREVHSHLSSCRTCSILLDEVRAENQRLGGRGRSGLLVPLPGGAALGGGTRNSRGHPTGAPEAFGPAHPVGRRSTSGRRGAGRFSRRSRGVHPALTRGSRRGHPRLVE